MRRLLDEMAAWDAAETAARGIDAEALVRLYYSDPPERLAKFAAPAASLFPCGDARARRPERGTAWPFGL